MDKGYQLDVIPIPTTNRYTIVFPYNPISNKFEIIHYQPTMTDGRMSLEELLQFLQGLESQIQTCTSKSGRNSLLKCFCLLFLLVSLAVIIVPVFAKDFLIEEFKKGFYVLLGVLLVGFLLFYFFLARFTLKSHRGMKKVAEQAMAYVNEKGKELQAKGLTWIVPQCYPAWIELWKDTVPLNHVVYTNDTLNTDQQEYKILRQDTAASECDDPRSPITSP